MSEIRRYFRNGAYWIGVQPGPTRARLIHAFIGASFGIFFTGFVMRAWLAGGSGGSGLAGLPLLIAPVGASAVLLFAVPASPLAQPWAVVGGNTISALSGILWMKIIGDPAMAAPLAVATAIAMMSLARCLHPPGGAVALTSVIGGHAIVAAGWGFAFIPVAVNSVLLVSVGLLYNATTRGNYPHRAASYTAPAPAAAGYTIADIESVLAQYDELLDVSSEDLDTLFRQVETRAYRRLHGVIRCEQIMQRAYASLAPDDAIASARQLFATRKLRVVPVVAGDGHLEGVLSVDMLAPDRQGQVFEAMNASPCVARPDTPIDELLPLLSGGIFYEALIVDGQGVLLGLVTQTDLLAALWRGHIAEHIALTAG